MSCKSCGGLSPLDSWRELRAEGVIWLGRLPSPLCGRPASTVCPSRFIDVRAGVKAPLWLLSARGVCLWRVAVAVVPVLLLCVAECDVHCIFQFLSRLARLLGMAVGRVVEYICGGAPEALVQLRHFLRGFWG